MLSTLSFFSKLTFAPLAANAVWLSTLAQGRFSKNGVVILPGTTDIEFIPFGALDITTLRKTLRVEHLQQHLDGSLYVP